MNMNLGMGMNMGMRMGFPNMPNMNMFGLTMPHNIYNNDLGLNENNSLSLTEDKDYDKKENLIKLFVGGLNYISFQSDIKSYFDTFGRVIECTLMVDKTSGKSKCYAFVTLEDINGTAKQRIMSRKHEINGKIVDVKEAVEGKEKEELMDAKKKIFVGGLDPQVTSKDLEEYFKEFGFVKEASVMYDSDRGISRCFGFVTFEFKEIVDELVKKQNFAIKGKQIEVKHAVPKAHQKPIHVISKSGVDQYLNQNKKNFSKPFSKKPFNQKY